LSRRLPVGIQVQQVERLIRNLHTWLWPYHGTYGKQTMLNIDAIRLIVAEDQFLKRLTEVFSEWWDSEYT